MCVVCLLFYAIGGLCLFLYLFFSFPGVLESTVQRGTCVLLFHQLALVAEGMLRRCCVIDVISV